jgi:hypothetical protein
LLLISTERPSLQVGIFLEWSRCSPRIFEHEPAAFAITAR